MGGNARAVERGEGRAGGTSKRNTRPFAISWTLQAAGVLGCSFDMHTAHLGSSLRRGGAVVVPTCWHMLESSAPTIIPSTIEPATVATVCGPLSGNCACTACPHPSPSEVSLVTWRGLGRKRIEFRVLINEQRVRLSLHVSPSRPHPHPHPTVTLSY
jgi:hypothetical protein